MLVFVLPKSDGCVGGCRAWGFGEGLVFPNRDVLLWLVFVFCDNPKRPPVFGLALEELAGGLAKKELNAMFRVVPVRAGVTVGRSKKSVSVMTRTLTSIKTGLSLRILVILT